MQKHDSAQGGSAKHSPAAEHYQSNPFIAARKGIEKLINTNAQNVVGVALLNVLLFVVVMISGLVFVLGLLTFMVNHWGLSLPFGSAMDFISSTNDISVYATWAISLTVLAFILVLMQSLQLNLTVAASRGQSLKFGQLIRASIGKVPPILGLIGLALLAAVLGFLLLAVLMPVLGYAVYLLGMAYVLAFVYAGVRLSYAAYCIVDLNLGPIDAIIRSWKISSGHLIETIGSAAVASLVTVVPSIIFTALARLTESVPFVSGLFSLLEAITMLVLVIGAAMVIAERYKQLQELYDRKIKPAPFSPHNYSAVALVLVAYFILSALTPPSNTNLDPRGNWYQNSAETPSIKSSDIKVN